jgi:hypothetical protein
LQRGPTRKKPQSFRSGAVSFKERDAIRSNG